MDEKLKIRNFESKKSKITDGTSSIIEANQILIWKSLQNWDQYVMFHEYNFFYLLIKLILQESKIKTQTHLL